MKKNIRERIALLFLAVLFILALVPAYYPLEDVALQNDSLVSRAYGLLFAAISPVYSFDYEQCCVETSSPLKKIGALPTVLSFSTETRAPPA